MEGHQKERKATFDNPAESQRDPQRRRQTSAKGHPKAKILRGKEGSNQEGRNHNRVKKSTGKEGRS